MIFAALDWSELNHKLVILESGGSTLVRKTLENNHTGLSELDALLAEHSSTPQEVHMAIELNEGLLLDWLLDKNYRVYGINPKSAERARDRYSPAGLKDDERDAWTLAEFLRTSYQHLHTMRPCSALTMSLRAWVRHREHVMHGRTMHLQQLRSHLAAWHPHFLRTVRDLNTQWALGLLERCPTADDFARLTSRQIGAFGRKRRMRLITRDRILTQATMCSPACYASRNDAHAAIVKHHVAAIQTHNTQIEDIECALNELIEQHPDANIFRSLPVKGSLTTATLLAGFGEDRERWSGYEEVAARWGAAPVTRQSGKHRSVHYRAACDKTMNQAWLWFSFNTVRQKDCWANDYYQSKRQAGAQHYTTLRCVAQRSAPGRARTHGQRGDGVPRTE